MSLTNTDSQTAGFPLVIPTSSQLPTARLVLRNNRGQVVQQWLVKQNKCTLGSASSCSLRCDMEGVAPYHALLVIGARQIFIRALAPKLTRDGRPFNEILLTEEESYFEIAGHRFELSRSGEVVRAASGIENPKPERLKFTLARPFELSSRKSVAGSIVSESKTKPDDNSGNASNFDSRWVAQLIQAAVQPLECQLHNLIEPLTELQSESRRQRRQRKKRQAEKRRQPASQSADDSSAPTLEIAPQVSSQVEALVVKHSAAMEVLTERISDVNQQLSAIERIIAEERMANAKDDTQAKDPLVAKQTAAIEQLQAGVAAVSAALESLQSGHAQERGENGQWKSTVQEQLSGLTQIIDSLATTVTEIRRTVLSQAELGQTVENQKEDVSFKSEVRERLAGLASVIDGLSVTVAEVQEYAVNQATNEQPASDKEADEQWKSNVQLQLVGLSQVIDSLTSTVGAIHETAINRAASEQLSSDDKADDEWKSNVQLQLEGLTQVIDSLSVSVAEIHRIASSERPHESHTSNGIENQSVDEFCSLEIAPADSVEVPSADCGQWDSAVDQSGFEPEQSLDLAAQQAVEVEESITEDDFDRELALDAGAIWTDANATPFEHASHWETAESSIEEDEFHFGGDSLEYVSHESSDASLVESLPDEADQTERVDEAEESQVMAALPEQFIGPVQESELELADSSPIAETEHSEVDTDLERPVEMAEDLPTQIAAKSQVEDQVEDQVQIEGQEQPPTSPGVELPSWWREEDQREPGSDQSQASCALAPSQDFAGEVEDCEQLNLPLKSVVEYKDESEEFFGLAQLDLDEEIAIEEPPPLPALLKALEDEASDQEATAEEVGEEEELIGFGAEVLIHQELPNDVSHADRQPELEELNSEDTNQEEPKLSLADPALASVLAVRGDSDGDDSVEEYMRKLLARMRGVPENEVEIPALSKSQSPAAKSSAPVRTPAPSATTGSESAEAGEATSASAPRTTVFAPKTELDSVEVTEPFDPEKYMPRALAPERSKSMAAMRELANSSARTAIHKSTRQRHFTSIMLKAVIAFVGLVVGSVLVAINGFNFNIGLVATLAAFLVAAIWGYDSLTSIRPMLRAGLVLRPQIDKAKQPQVEEEDE